MDNHEIINRLKKNKKKFHKFFLGRGTNCYRAYDRDLPNWPFIAEYLNEIVVVWERIDPRKDSPLKTETFVNAVKEVYDCEVILKKRQKQKGKDQYEKESKNSREHIVTENNFQYVLRPDSYVDVGLFLDHRPLREKLSKDVGGLKVLNLFCYTGSLSVAAAKGGGTVTSVDMSNTYLNWAKENFKLNNIRCDESKFIRADILTWVDEATDQYDLIICDPPVFSTSKKMEDSWDVQRNHVHLLSRLKHWLFPGGLIIFSNNKRDFKLSEKVQEEFLVENWTKKSIPQDFHDPKIHNCHILSFQ